LSPSSRHFRKTFVPLTRLHASRNHFRYCRRIRSKGDFVHSAFRHRIRAFLVWTFPVVILFLSPASTLNARQAPPNDHDRLMEKVLMHRKVNQEVLRDYVLNDVEQMDVTGPGEYTLYRGKEEYVWYVRDGINVRSPLRRDGVTIGKNERKE